ncbi:class I SAM-dependent methyltransferase [Halioxenophilus aromaticivorans]|uniref:Methyltransferase domain-containing protein n=1 Tax=Halioxenophilus aromaticivorans TaxID=1306992 RepID=A0AAV3TX68_9ALTE
MSKNPFLDQSALLPGPVREAYHQRFGVLPWAHAVPDIENWGDTPLGESLLLEEQSKLDEALGYMFGYHLLQLSVDRRAKLYGNSKVNHCFGLHPLTCSGGEVRGLSDFEQLPLEKRSIDVAILHHVLDYAEHPHRVLREVVRTLVPHGYLVLVGFNPASPMGASSLIARHVSRKSHQRKNALRLSRVVDWLRVLDCEPVRIDHGHFRLPFNSRFLVNHTRWLEKLGGKLLKPMGSFYMIVARKEQVSSIPMKPQWQPVNVMSGFGVGKVTSRVPEGVAVKSASKIKH